MEMNTPSLVVSKLNALSEYSWGNNCKAWNLVNNKDLSIKLEEMPAETDEVLHYHHLSQQFFYILKGTALFEVDDVILVVHQGEGLEIKAGQKHRIINNEQETLQFLVCSQPAINTDRHNLV